MYLQKFVPEKEGILKLHSSKKSLFDIYNVDKQIKQEVEAGEDMVTVREKYDYNNIIKEAFLLGISGVEVWYDYEMYTKWKFSEHICYSINSLVKSLGLLSSCGTDSHGLSLFGR